jgi:hypothetical protein
MCLIMAPALVGLKCSSPVVLICISLVLIILNSTEDFKILFLLLLYLGYIVTLTKVLTTYHSWNHPIHPSLHSWNSFNTSLVSIHIHEYIIFHCICLLHSSLLSSHLTGINDPSSRDLFSLFVLSLKKMTFWFV